MSLSSPNRSGALSDTVDKPYVQCRVFGCWPKVGGTDRAVDLAYESLGAEPSLVESSTARREIESGAGGNNKRERPKGTTRVENTRDELHEQLSEVV